MPRIASQQGCSRNSANIRILLIFYENRCILICLAGPKFKSRLVQARMSFELEGCRCHELLRSKAAPAILQTFGFC